MRYQSIAHRSATLSFCVPLGAECPYCGDPIIAPEETEFVAGRGIRHTWVCDSCGQLSCTTVLTRTN